MSSVKDKIKDLWLRGKSIAQIEKKLNVRIDTRAVSFRSMHNDGVSWVKDLKVKKLPAKKKKDTVHVKGVGHVPRRTYNAVMRSE